MRTKIDPWTGKPSGPSKYDGWTDAQIQCELADIAAEELEAERKRVWEAANELLLEELRREREAAYAPATDQPEPEDETSPDQRSLPLEQ